MININYGKNRVLLRECKPLGEYSWFVDRVRTCQKEMKFEDAVDKALDDMPDDFIIKPFLMANRAEVMNMCLTEYDEEKLAETFRAEGRAEGEIKGTIRTLVALFKKGLINESSAAETAGMTVEDFKKAEALYCN